MEISKQVNLKNRYELVILGCGPAGMAAAINAKIRKRDFVLLGAEFCSPKLSKSPWIDNFIGFPGIKGEDLRQNFLRHLQEMEIEIVPWKVSNIYPGPPFTLLGNNHVLEADAIVLATGVSAQKLFPGESELLGRGVGYCATCDGPLYKGKDVAIIAYDAEGEAEANFMADICSKVYYIPYYQELGKLDERIILKKGIVERISGSQKVDTLVLRDQELPVDGVFILRHSLPVEQLVAGLNLANGAAAVNHNLETNIPGLFAAGDCTGQPYQLMKAAGEGGTAALLAIKYLDALRSGSAPDAQS